MKNLEPFNAELRQDGPPPCTTFAAIDHENFDGEHVFTSKQIPGLICASRDLEKALERLPFLIEQLVWLNDQIECTVTLRGFSEPGKPPAKTADLAIITKKVA